MTSGKQQFMVHFGYAGDRFHGVSLQPDVHTAGAALLARLAHATEQKPHAVSFAARTDAGVRALGNLATFRLAHPVDCAAVIAALQSDRHDGLTGVVARTLPRRVMARNMAAEKHYCYRFAGPNVMHLADPQTWRLAVPWSPPRLRRAMSRFIGTHDFSAFCYGAGAAGSNRRSIRHIAIESIGTPASASSYTDSAEVAVHVFGDGFLRRMLRMMMFTAMEVACGLRTVRDMSVFLQPDGRCPTMRVSNSAPARGLTLVGLTLTAQAQAICRLPIGRAATHKVPSRQNYGPMS